MFWICSFLAKLGFIICGLLSYSWPIELLKTGCRSICKKSLFIVSIESLYKNTLHIAVYTFPLVKTNKCQSKSLRVLPLLGMVLLPFSYSLFVFVWCLDNKLTHIQNIVSSLFANSFTRMAWSQMNFQLVHRSYLKKWFYLHPGNYLIMKNS